MNDTTLPIKQGGKKKIVNPRQQRDGKNLRPRFGLHDWVTLLRHAKDLAQRKGSFYWQHHNICTIYCSEATSIISYPSLLIS